MKYQASVAIGYKDIFEDYDTINPVDLIVDIPTKNSLEIIGYFTAQMHTRERNFEKQIEFLNMWCRRLPHEIIPTIEDFISRTTVKGKSEFNFINNIASSILIELVIDNNNDLNPVDNLTPEQELNLFKAYLWCNQNWTDKQIGFVPQKIKTPDDLISVIFPIQLPYLEILEFKDFRLQFLKAVYFFKFCEKDDVFKDYLTSFLQEYNIESWQKYLVNILNLYLRKFEALKTPYILNIQDEFPEIKNFIEQFCIDERNFTITDDFNSIRKKPIYKIDENNYLFLNLNFFVDKLFQGIQFEFFRVLKKNKLKYKNKEIISFDQFRSIYAEQISEKGIFYETLKYSFEKNRYNIIDGQTLKDKLKEGEPDFYIRDKGKIYLFEYKDVILNAKIKHSYDFEKIKDEISIKMISNQKGSQKGITQLFNSISKIKNEEYNEVDNYSQLKDCIIYPIIVFTDFSFNLPGVNYFLNKKFREMIENSELKDKHKIKDLTLIDLDTFLKFQDLFREKKLKINNCLNEYCNYTKTGLDIFNKIGTFNIFLHNKTMKMKYDSPKLLFEEVEKMLPNE
jgi:hypothetical protein